MLDYSGSGLQMFLMQCLLYSINEYTCAEREGVELNGGSYLAYACKGLLQSLEANLVFCLVNGEPNGSL